MILHSIVPDKLYMPNEKLKHQTEVKSWLLEQKILRPAFSRKGKSFVGYGIYGSLNSLLKEATKYNPKESNRSD